MSILVRLWRLGDEMHSLPTKRAKRILRCATDAAKEIDRLERENTTLRSLAAAMADEMEQHGGEQAFDSLARYRAEMGKEAKP